MPEFIIRAVLPGDIQRIAEIHRASFDDRALTQLGAGAVRRYYHWLLTGFSEIFPLCAVTASNQMAGFCFAGVYSGSFSGFIQRHRWYLAGCIVLRPWLIFHPLVRSQTRLAFRTLQYQMIKRKKGQKHKSAASTHPKTPSRVKSLGVLSIAVDPQFQRRGVGELMMQAVAHQARSHGYTSLHLSVHPDNLAAVKFYQKLGWHKAQADENWQGIMVMRL